MEELSVYNNKILVIFMGYDVQYIYLIMKLLKLSLVVPLSHHILKNVDSNLLHSPTSFKIVDI